MPRIGLPELIVILIVALLIFGPKNLPKLGAAIGKTVNFSFSPDLMHLFDPETTNNLI